jgi:hypothetical protein
LSGVWASNERALRRDMSITTPHTHILLYTQVSKKAHRSIISNVQVLVRLISAVIDEANPGFQLDALYRRRGDAGIFGLRGGILGHAERWPGAKV